MQTWQALGGVGAGRTATAVVIAALLATLIALGCSSERTPSPENAASPVVIAAGNIASCPSEGDEATATLVSGVVDSTVLALGDNAYPRGAAQKYEECYGPTWGRFKYRTKPVPGNHEYYTKEAAGYFDYFGKAAGDPGKGYYSYDLGAWHLIALNSNCEKVGGCDASSPQVRWLEADLAKHDRSCTLAYFHHDLFTSGKHRPGDHEVKPLWEALYQANADVLLSADDHNYQRFAPQDPEGRADPERGIRAFVVGTGGKSHYEISEISDPMANTEVHNDDTYGVLKLTLRPKGYEWRFVPVEGKAFTDSGSAKCH